ncbi:ORF1 [Alloteropsis cryptic virus 1]|nr:ORF1 [Alloteropsis cryptic virus 1]
MNPHVPPAMPNGPHAPDAPVPPANPPQHIPPADPIQGAAHQEAAPAPRRARTPRGVVPTNSRAQANCAPAMLELAAAYPMYTVQRRSVNYFVPDATMLFHLIGICDQMMLTTERFIRSSPAWLPIVTQLYISVLWNVMIIKVFVNSGYGFTFANIYNDLVNHLRIDECMIPGPLVPFFQALAAVNGPFEWTGDVLPGLPNFSTLWDASNFAPHSSFARQLPIPAIILDQLAYFASRPNPAGITSQYQTFEWYRNVFSQGSTTYDSRCRMGPQLCASLFCTSAQFDAAKSFWNSVLTDFTRINGALENQPLTNYLQLLGFSSQANALQGNWFQHVCIVMQKYCQYFNGSLPLKSISPVGIGAVLVRGTPNSTTLVRNWVYPDDRAIEVFTSTRYAARREIPENLSVKFHHADHNLEEQAEQYAVLTHTNIDWSVIQVQNDWQPIVRNRIYEGDYWTQPTFRDSMSVTLKLQFAQLVASRYHQQTALHAE